MENNSRLNEILIMTNTSFSSREWLLKSENVNKPQSKKERLKQACWDGLVPDLLPECFDFMFNRSIVLWEINEANTFIDLEYGDQIPSIQKDCSLNPYVFMEVQEYN